MYFRNYRLSKIWLGHSLKSVVSEHPSTVNMLKISKHLWNLHESTFIMFFPSFLGELIWKISPIFKFQITGVFVNTLTADYKYPISDCENLALPIDMQLS